MSEIISEIEQELISQLRVAKKAYESLIGHAEFSYVTWRFRDAPWDLQALSPHGGDEDWLTVCGPGADGDPSWAQSGGPYGRCDVSSHSLPGGITVLIGAHS